LPDPFFEDARLGAHGLWLQPTLRALDNEFSYAFCQHCKNSKKQTSIYRRVDLYSRTRQHFQSNISGALFSALMAYLSAVWNWSAAKYGGWQ
jgi:hypothetical protein